MMWLKWLNANPGMASLASLAATIVTAIMVWATFRMARYTLDVANFTKESVDEAKEARMLAVRDASEARRQADQHHQEGLRPYLVIEILKADRLCAFGTEFAPHPASQDGGVVVEPHISIVGKLHNKGLGPATDVVVYLNWGSSVEAQGYYLTHPVVVTGLIGAGESIDIDISILPHQMATKVVEGKAVPTAVLEQAARDAQEVVLRYRDVFNNPFRTVLAKGFLMNVHGDSAIMGGDVELEKLKATRPDRPTPVFLAGVQPWLTLADAPRLPVVVDFADQPESHHLGLL